MGIIRVAVNVVEYWLEGTKRIMIDIDCILTQKLSSAASLLWDEAYHWWLTVEQGAQPKQINLDYFKYAFQNKHVGARNVEAHQREFMNLVQGERFVAKFLKLSKYAWEVTREKSKQG